MEDFLELQMAFYCRDFTRKKKVKKRQKKKKRNKTRNPNNLPSKSLLRGLHSPFTVVLFHDVSFAFVLKLWVATLHWSEQALVIRP